MTELNREERWEAYAEGSLCGEASWDYISTFNKEKQARKWASSALDIGETGVLIVRVVSCKEIIRPMISQDGTKPPLDEFSHQHYLRVLADAIREERITK